MIKILKNEFELFEEANDITGTEYLKEINEDNYVDENTLMEMIGEIIDCYRKLEEEKEELEYKLENDYEPRKFDAYYEYGISESDFH